MNEKSIGRYFRVYEEGEVVEDNDFKPEIEVTPEVEVDKRRYTSTKKTTPQKQNNPTINPSTPPPYTAPQPQYIPPKNRGVVTVNGKTIGDLVRDVVYYNKNNPYDPGNFADVVAAGALATERYAKGGLEKAVVFGGVTYIGIKLKKYLHEKFVK